MAADIKQDYLFVRDHHGKRDSETVSKAHSLYAFHFPAKTVKLQMRLKGIFFQIINDTGKPFPQPRMFPEKFLGPFKEIV
jgi:hypothetical protein